MEKIVKYHPLFYLVTLPLLGKIYNYLNHADDVVYSMVTGLDTAIPLIKPFIVPYMLWSPFILMMMLYLFKKDLQTYYNVLITLNITLLFNYFVFVVFQTTVPRPMVTGIDFWSMAVRLLYTFDPPYNCFPSGHVVTSWVVLLGAFKVSAGNRKLMIGVMTVVMMIIVSTLFLKQHALIDVAVSIFLGSVVFPVVTVFDLGRFWEWTGRLLLPNKGIRQES